MSPQHKLKTGLIHSEQEYSLFYYVINLFTQHEISEITVSMKKNIVAGPDDIYNRYVSTPPATAENRSKMFSESMLLESVLGRGSGIKTWYRRP